MNKLTSLIPLPFLPRLLIRKKKLTSLMDTFVLLGSASMELSFLLHKKKLQREHRQECYSLVQRIFGRGPSLEGDFILINFFALVFFYH